MALLEGKICISPSLGLNNAYVYAALILDIILVEIPP